VVGTLPPATIADDAWLTFGDGILWLEEPDAISIFTTGPDSTPNQMKFPVNNAALFKAMEQGGSKIVLAKESGLSLAELDCIVSRLREWDAAALICQNGNISVAEDAHRRAIEIARLRDIFAAMQSAADTNATFHSLHLSDAEQQFDAVETTISHAYREPHAALNGKTYGMAFCDWLVDSGRLRPGCRLLEIGCGLGYFAKAILDRLASAHPDIYCSLSYTMFDLSPELQAAQQRNCASHGDRLRFLTQNIETHDFGAERYDLILSNEVVADLSVGTATIANIAADRPQTESEALACAYQLDCVPIKVGSQKKAVINVGAIKMLQNAAKAMAPSAHAVITEYGTNGQSPKAVTFANHNEFTVDFGHLVRVGHALGLRADRETMGDLLGFDAQSETISMTSLQTLNRALLPYCGKAVLPTLAYTPATLRDVLGTMLAQIGNIRFLPLNHPNSFSPYRFEVLTLSR
jgi:2-polyprenyl-3-methyl-5-hydroxy-6-metoxy-1,4-benzoquinol methylase